jgi:hypothetical protein
VGLAHLERSWQELGTETPRPKRFHSAFMARLR